MKSAQESIRSFLIAEALQFIATAQRLPGVRRIALIGSLTTAKKNPKDVDVLIWVDDGADLQALAAAARRLTGRAQSRNKGADIFLANTENQYLGRICHHRECRPGIRVCPARHCARRPYLCDDLDVLDLPAQEIAAPPLELWPTVVRRRPIPNDVVSMIS